MESSPEEIVINVKQQEDVDHFKYFGSMITKDARCTREIQSRIYMEKDLFNNKKTFHQQVGHKIKEESRT
jgi:hypothetical protein